MIIKEYVCLAHGDFDAGTPTCPHGCGVGMVQRAFRTPPAIRSAGFSQMNRTFQSLADEHGMSNLSNAGRDGMRRADYATHKRLADATELIVQQGDRRGMNASDYFQPMNQFTPGSTGEGGALQKVGGKTVLSNGVELNRPVANLQAQPFDGSALGVPVSDA